MEKIIEKYISLCTAYAESKKNVLSYKAYDEKEVCRFVVVFPLVKVEFRYVKKPKSFENPNTFYCVVYLNKNSKIYYHLPDLIPYFESKDFRCTYFSAIESADRMENCFTALACVIDSNFAEIEKLALDDKVAQSALFDLYRRFYSLKETDLDFTKALIAEGFDRDFFLDLQKKRDRVMLLRFATAGGYANLLQGKKRKAVAFYEKWDKKGILFEYENQLLEFLKSADSEGFAFVPDECNSSADIARFNSPLSGIRAGLVLFAVFAVIFCSAFALYNYIAGRDAVFTIAAPFYLGLMPALLCTIFGTIAFYGYIPDKKFKEGKKQEMYKAVNTKATRIAATVAFAVVFVVSVLFSAMMVSCDVRFYDEEIRFATGEFSVKHENHKYSEIDGVYYISARYNYLDERIERPSYLILFNDKKVLDLDGYTSVEFSEKNVIPFLEEKGFSVKRVDSDKDLPPECDYY